MDNVSQRTMLRSAKKKSGDFTQKDLAQFVRERAQPDAQVTVLKENKWVKVGNWWLKLVSQASNMDDAWITVIVRPNTPYMNWVRHLNIHENGMETLTVLWWYEIGKTGLLLDIWYVGDGSEGVALVVPAK
ncbi:MAG: hypothetical protein ACOZAO_02610 [Patescibacteria group bacterium]